MTAYTSPKTYSGGSQLTASELNTYQRDNIKNLDERLTLIGATSTSSLGHLKTEYIGGGRYRDADTVPSISTWTTVDLATGTLFDSQPSSMFASSDRVVIPSLGLYRLTHWIAMSGGTSGVYGSRLLLNGATELFGTSDTNEQNNVVRGARLHGERYVHATAGTYYQLQVWTNIPATLHEAWLTCMLVAEQ